MQVVIPRNVVNQILSHVQQQPDTEVCGFIASREGKPERVYRVDNVADAPSVLFQMAPAGQIDAMRTMRETGEELFAIYHSHPHSPPLPSERDLREAAYPDALYLIVSLDTKGVLDMRGYRLGNSAIENIELQLAP